MKDTAAENPCLRGEAEMRALLASCGLSANVIERAVKVRYQTPAEEQYVDGRRCPRKRMTKPRGRHAKKNPAKSKLA